MHPLAHPLSRPRRIARAARVTTAALALTTAALTVTGAAAGSTGAGATTSTSTATGAVAVSAAPCLSASPDHRVRAGSASDGADPNTLSLAQTRRAENRLDARVQQRRTTQRAVGLPSTRIDVYVHVITRSDGKGGVSTKRIEQQIAVLNKAYGGKTTNAAVATPFTFKLKKIDRTKKSSWYYWTPPNDTSLGDDVAPKTKLHKGGPDDLNLYLAKIDDGVLGYASFPWDTTLKRDGVVVLGSSLPGGSATGYNQGDTATHEVGHWLGLLHTFQNGCLEPGDAVDDTPAQADGENIFSCSESLDTCPAEGTDPVHNFMSYGDDKCLNRFTPGQVARMTEVWQTYRAPGVVS